MYLSYDIEIYNDLTENDPSTPLEKKLNGIIPSIAATCTTKDDLKYWYDTPYMTPETACKLVVFMQENLEKGIIPFTWNGTYFDFPLLAKYSGMLKECGELALNSIDGMLLITFARGFFLSLDSALTGAGLETKTHTVTLKDGSVFSEMTGRLAPEMWRNGEYEAVKTYLEGDVFRPLELIFAIKKNAGIKWQSKAGKWMFQSTTLMPVKDLFKLPLPDTSWMTSNIRPRSEFVSWIPNVVLDKYNIPY
jgi:hypothetical protein